MSNPIPVFYSDHMVADSESYSPSAAKPAQVMAEWKRLAYPIEVFEPRPVTVEELCAAHDPAFVEGVLSGEVENGFGNKPPPPRRGRRPSRRRAHAATSPGRGSRKRDRPGRTCPPHLSRR